MRACTPKYLEETPLYLRTFRTRKRERTLARLCQCARSRTHFFLFSHEKWSERRTAFEAYEAYDAQTRVPWDFEGSPLAGRKSELLLPSRVSSIVSQVRDCYEVMHILWDATPSSSTYVCTIRAISEIFILCSNVSRKETRIRRIVSYRSFFFVWSISETINYLQLLFTQACRDKTCYLNNNCFVVSPT